MNTKSNLRFFLALGGQKVVVLQDQQHMQIYADKKPVRGNVSVERMSAVLQTK